MNPPFSAEQFLEIFRVYNQAVFPTQLAIYLLGGISVYLGIKPNALSDKIITLILGLLWLWMGIVYHIIFFTAINKAAYLFGLVFILQGIVFLIVGVIKSKLSFKFQFNAYGVIGIILVIFSLIVYPILGYTFGHVYPASPTFGLPCPTTIFTFGLLLMNIKKTPVVILIIPCLWSIVGFTAALQFNVFEDVGLLVASVLTTYLLIHRNNKLSRKVNEA